MSAIELVRPVERSAACGPLERFSDQLLKLLRLGGEGLHAVLSEQTTGLRLGCPTLSEITRHDHEALG